MAHLVHRAFKSFGHIVGGAIACGLGGHGGVGAARAGAADEQQMFARLHPRGRQLVQKFLIHLHGGKALPWDQYGLLARIA